MIMTAVVGCLLLFAVLAGLILFWVRGQVKRQQQVSTVKDDRQLYIQLATEAANDESGRALLILLKALDVAGPDCPITIGWLHHTPTKGKSGLLVKIAWDGNEWRRVYEIAPFRARLEGWLAAEPKLDGEHVRRLLADLSALAT
jgi:hypothetical protein